jgi:hypothetical protein
MRRRRRRIIIIILYLKKRAALHDGITEKIDSCPEMRGE